MRRARARTAILVAAAATLLLASQALAAGPGDEVGDPILITADQFGIWQPYDTSEATANPATDPADCEGQSGFFEGPFSHTVWHSFTPEADGLLLVSVNSFPDPEAEGFLAILFVYTDDGAGGLGLVGCNAFGADVQFEATAGTTYLAMTGSLPETPVGGPAEIIVTTPLEVTVAIDSTGMWNPINDTATVSGTITCSEPAFADFLDVQVTQTIGHHELFGFGFTTPGDCSLDPTAWSVQVETFGGPLNPGSVQATVFASACANACGFAFAEATVHLQPAPAQPPPPPPAPDNDERGGAIAIALDGVATQDTTGATVGADDPQDCPNEPIPPSGTTVWYAFTAPADGFFEVNTIGSDYDTTLHVLAPDGSVVACDDDIERGFIVESQLTFEAVAGTTYLIMVGSFGEGPGGNLTLTVIEGVEPPPPPPGPANDDMADALSIELGDSIGPLDITGATAELADPAECAPPSSTSVWFSYTAAADGWVEATTLGSDFETVLVVLQDGVVVACDSNGSESSVTFFGEAGVTYLLMAGNWDSTPSGNLVLNLVEASEPLQVQVDFVSAEIDRHANTVTVTGIVTCNMEAQVGGFAGIDQQQGRFTASAGEVWFSPTCTPDGVEFQAVMPAGDLQPGGANLFIDAEAFTADDSAFVFASFEIEIRPAGSHP